MDFINALYHVTGTSREIDRLARDIALEQTVEVPESLVTDPVLRERYVGRVLEVLPVGEGIFAVKIAYNAELANGQLPQLLNLIYGNISIKNNIRLMNVDLPKEFLAGLTGPRYGIAGLRALTGVYGRPLLATALKPRGSTVEQFAAIAEGFALGGGDIIKDDHNLVDDTRDQVAARIRACQSAMSKANQATGRNTLYFPHISGPVDQIGRLAEIALAAGVRGVLVSPGVIGLDTVRWLAERYGLAIMTHPTFTGTFFHDSKHGMEPGVLLGTLFRLACSDISVFPNSGGRFGFSHEQCLGIRTACTGPLHSLAPNWPAPAGGMTFDNIAVMAKQYGADAVFICGGALLSHGSSLEESTRAMRAKVCEHFEEQVTTPQRDWRPAGQRQVKDFELHRAFVPTDWTWEGCARVAYKGEKRLPFKDILRAELFGKNGEQAGFELRYFEIQPGGFSSREKHVHVHCVIGARGEGELNIDGTQVTLKPFD